MVVFVLNGNLTPAHRPSVASASHKIDSAGHLRIVVSSSPIAVDTRTVASLAPELAWVST
jgi:hypothetical protein